MGMERSTISKPNTVCASLMRSSVEDNAGNWECVSHTAIRTLCCATFLRAEARTAGEDMVRTSTCRLADRRLLGSRAYSTGTAQSIDSRDRE